MHSKFHLIGIDEPPMASLALALHQQGHLVTSSSATPPTDSIVAELAHNQLLPTTWGYAASHVPPSCEAVIVGRKALGDQIEVITAQSLGIPVYSYPAYLHHYAQHKQRIVVLGEEHAVASFLAICRHVMNYCGYLLDYVAAPQLDNITCSTQLSNAPTVLLQGDTSIFSTLDPRSSASIYQPHIVVMLDMDAKQADAIEGEAARLRSYSDIADTIPKAGKLVYNRAIAQLQQIASKNRADVQAIPFQAHILKAKKEKNFLSTSRGEISFPYTDQPTLQALSAAYQLLHELAVTEEQFYEAVAQY